MIGTFFNRKQQTDESKPVKHLLIASEGRPISDEVIARAVDMLQANGGRATVLTIARLWGTSFGLPSPGLRPTKREMDEQKENMFSALNRLEEAGIEVDGHIVTTRNPCKSIRKQVTQKDCDAIIMGADPRRPWFVRNMMWSQEPYRVQSGMTVPVHLVCPQESVGTSGRQRGSKRSSLASVSPARSMASKKKAHRQQSDRIGKAKDEYLHSKVPSL